MIDLTEFLIQGFNAQQDYATKSNQMGPLDKLSNMERHSKVVEHIGHLIEEAVETRMLVPRRSWKVSEESYLDSIDGRKEFCYELTDILLFFRAIVAYSGISIDEFEKYFMEKMNYNTKRTDHK